MEDRSPVAAVILAAGLGTRFGGPKALAALDGMPLVERVAALAREAGLRPIICVVPPATSVPPFATPVINPRPERGLSSSLQLGIVAVPEGHAALVLLVDQPTLSPGSIAAVLAARGARPLVAASADGRLGPPVLVEPAAYPLVMALTGDIGLREVLAERRELVEAVRVAAHPPSVETPGDLARLEAEARLGS
jgi:nicotine blue oxidoreductase